MAGGIINPNGPFQIAFQNGFLARFFEEGLDSEAAFQHDCVVEMIPIRAGQSITKTRVGRTPPQISPLNPANVTGLDNGLTASTPNMEQYTYNVNEYGGLKQLDLAEELAGISDQLKMLAHTNGVEAAQTVERLVKQTWFANYNTGNTWVRGDLGSVTSSTLHVDDIRGFQFNYVNGQPEPVSSSNPLPVAEYGSQPQTFNVIGAVADSPTQSVYPSSNGITSDGISGVLTYNSASVGDPVSGDAIISSIAPVVLRPNNKLSTNALTTQDTLSVQLLQAAQTTLSQNAVPKHRDKTYHCYLDYHAFNELMADQQFQIMYASRGANPEYQNAQVFTIMGLTVIPTTEVYLQNAVTAAGMQNLGTAQVHRVLVTGAGGINIGHFSGLESFAERGDAVGHVSQIFMVDHIAHIVRSPIDNMGRQLSMAWLAMFALVCPTDLTATPTIIPTASNAAYKRAVVIEYV
jgi:hypothetical protein